MCYTQETQSIRLGSPQMPEMEVTVRRPVKSELFVQRTWMAEPKDTQQYTKRIDIISIDKPECFGLTSPALHTDTCA